MKVALALALVLALPAGAARAADRVAVLILPEPGTDPALADNVTEVAIARIAERQRVEMAGTVELRRRLGAESERRALACLDDIACLGRVAVALGVQRVVGGSVRTLDSGRFLIHATLTDVQSGRVTGRFFRLVESGVEALIRASQEGMDDLFRAREEPGRIRVESEPPRARVTIDDLFVGTTPVLSGTLLPGPHDVRVEKEDRFPWQDRVVVRPSTELEIKLTPEHLPRRLTWPRYAGFGGLALATVALGGGALLGVMSQEEPSSNVRLVAQQELHHRERLATRANVLFASGAALALGALALLLIYQRDVFGD
jgi:hypothetical protein